MLILLLCSFFVTFVAAVFAIRMQLQHAGQYDDAKPQRFHAGDVPRIGGVCMLAGVVCGWLLVVMAATMDDPLNVTVDWIFVLPWIVVLIPAVVGGAYEDLTQRLSVRYRLALTAMSAGLACWLMGLSVQRLGLPGIDSLLVAMPWAGIALAFIAICGLPHAFNIIDGYNGLAATVALLVCVAVAHVALQLGDRQLAAMVICMVGATAGFLLLNYPRGLIFAGDGGAYLWGLVIAVASITLVQRHSQISPWFPMLLLIYPVWETLFSIYRKIVRGSSPGVADALHFHQLIYRRIVRGVFHDDAARHMLIRNNRTSPYLWSFTLLTVVPALMFRTNTPILIAFCVLFVFSYVAVYIAIVRFKIPRWLRY